MAKESIKQKVDMEVLQADKYCSYCYYRQGLEKNKNNIRKVMKKEVVKCDKCGKDISPKRLMYGCSSHIEFTLEYWHCGSMGREDDRDHFNLDLCDDCSRELSYMIKRWIKENKK